ncbi:glycine cleavage system protein R [Ornithinimicrobium panacihumi]|uniref:glycine cleavage system protein R n=1 Tax=Ornithinimicrobium panacihumi TaxID=2008449 RepID=UPI003F8CB9D5
MTTLVITVIGDDRPGLVSELAAVVADHEGSWGRSQLAELAGKFAGIVTVDLPEAQVEAFSAALTGLEGALETSVHRAAETGEPPQDQGETFALELVGNDRPGIVKEISAVLAAQGVSIEELTTRTSPAPMTGGELFEAGAVLRAGGEGDPESVRAALEALADELMVEVSFANPDEPRGEQA